MKESYIIKAIRESKCLNYFLREDILAEIETVEFPSEEEIKKLKTDFRADRCEVAKCFR